MEYVTKTCPICGHEFVVLEEAEKKAVYCTIECLSTAQGKIDREKVTLFISV